jgi:ADP-ribose pyrophosphatase YjhB (NUDIX family)
MLHRGSIRHCKACGTAVQYRLPDDGDTRERAVCPSCHVIHYENPLNVVGTVPFIDDRVLLCLRNIEPRKGKWTLPAGFMELGETVAEGAQRETAEEAGADIELLDLFTLMNVVRVGQVHFFFRARLLSERFDPGHETQEVRLFREDEIPWDEIAFRTVRDTLRCFFADRARGQFDLHQIDIA